MLFLSNRSRNLHSTIVVIGDVDLDHGAGLGVDWYEDLASAAWASHEQEPYRPQDSANPPAIERSKTQKSSFTAGRGSCFGHFLPPGQKSVYHGHGGLVRECQVCMAGSVCETFRDYCHENRKTVIEALMENPKHMDHLLDIFNSIKLKREKEILEAKRKKKGNSKRTYSKKYACRWDSRPGLQAIAEEEVWVPLIEGLGLWQPVDVNAPSPGDCYLELVGSRWLCGCREMDGGKHRKFIVMAVSVNGETFNVRTPLLPGNPAFGRLSEHVRATKHGSRINDVCGSVSPGDVVSVLVAAKADLLRGEKSADITTKTPTNPSAT